MILFIHCDLAAVKYQKTVFAQYSFLNAVQSACFTDAFQSDQDLVISGKEFIDDFMRLLISM